MTQTTDQQLQSDIPDNQDLSLRQFTPNITTNDHTLVPISIDMNDTTKHGVKHKTSHIQDHEPCYRLFQ